MIAVSCHSCAVWCWCLHQSKQRQLGDVLDLSSYLLKPIQRLTKYAQLLKQIAKECPTTHPAYADLMVSRLIR